VDATMGIAGEDNELGERVNAGWGALLASIVQ
jgi:hypothetical protein